MTGKRRPTTGDKVKLLAVYEGQAALGFAVGQVHTIVRDDHDTCPYKIRKAWFEEERVELVEDELDQHAPGAKLDTDKPRVALVLAKALSKLIDQNSTEGRLLKLLIEVLK